MKKIVLIGAGGHCKVIIDLIQSIGQYEIIGITDKSEINKKALDIDVIGDDSILKELYKNGVSHAFITVGALENIKLRNKIYNNLKRIGFKLPVLIHKNAIVSKYSHIEEGTCIMAGSILNPNTYIGKNCILNTAAVIEHDCKINDNTHISSRVALAGGVSVGSNTHIGIGSTVIQGIKIGNNVTIGAGSVVINDINDNTVAVGVPARVIKLKDS